jgi:hypothetical protein
MKLALRRVAPINSRPGFLWGPRPGIARVRHGSFKLVYAAVECEKSRSHYADWAA